MQQFFEDFSFDEKQKGVKNLTNYSKTAVLYIGHIHNSLTVHLQFSLHLKKPNSYKLQQIDKDWTFHNKSKTF